VEKNVSRAPFPSKSLTLREQKYATNIRPLAGYHPKESLLSGGMPSALAPATGCPSVLGKGAAEILQVYKYILSVLVQQKSKPKKEHHEQQSRPGHIAG
jgi:hypothetical protein